jgi:hypothetical protein
MGPGKQGHVRYPFTSEDSILIIYLAHQKKNKYLTMALNMTCTTVYWKQLERERNILFNASNKTQGGGFLVG